MMKLDDIFRRYVTQPQALWGIPLTDLVTALTRFDLQIINEQKYLKFCLDSAPVTANSPALYN